MDTNKYEKALKLSHDILILSRNTLLVNLRFLDMALSRFELVPIETSTILTDGRYILYNPMHVLKSYAEIKEKPVRDYLHMVMHCVFRHMFVGACVNRNIWNIACDIAVENIITELEMKATAVPDRGNKQSGYIHKFWEKVNHLTAEKIYSYLCSADLSENELSRIGEVFRADDHNVWYMTSEEKETVFGISASGYSVNSVDKESEKTEEGDGVSISALERDWQKISERMQVDIETFGKQRGFAPGTMIQNLVAVNREKYDYTAFLKKFAVMGEGIKINDDEFDYIFYTYGLELYEKMPLIEPLEYKEVKAIKEFVIAIDTSGSTSGELVQKFVQKTYNILKQSESFHTKVNIHIIQCDADIQEDIKITCTEDFDEYLKTMQIRGLGGTDFRPVFEYVEELRMKKEFVNLKGLIYFTDGYGDFPAKKPGYDTAFVFVDDEYNNPDVPPWAIKLVLQKYEI